MIPCEVREELQRKVTAAYKEMWDRRYESDTKARAKLKRLLAQKHAHQHKHGCVRDEDSK